jgi:hypothetical protein
MGFAQKLHDIPGAMRPGSKLGHRTQIALLGWGQAIKAHPKEARIQLREGDVGGAQGILLGNRTALRLAVCY